MMRHIADGTPIGRSFCRSMLQFTICLGYNPLIVALLDVLMVAILLKAQTHLIVAQ